MEPDEILLETEDAMQKGVDYVLHEMSSVRTGKANPSLVEGIDVHVASYGSSMKLKQLAVISTPDARLITVSPFDPSTTGEIEKALAESKLGINPSVDGKLIRLPIPELSQERREDLVKVVKDMAEQGRIRIRSSRQEGMTKLKAGQKAGEITEDNFYTLEKDIQDLTDKYVKAINEHLESKEKEILTV